MLILAVCSLVMLVETRRLPCEIISKNPTARIQAVSKTKCLNVKVPHGKILAERNIFLKNITMELNVKNNKKKEQFLVHIRRTHRHMNKVSCFRVFVLTYDKGDTIKLSCSKRRLKRKGIVTIYRIKNSRKAGGRKRQLLIDNFTYKFQGPCSNFEPRVKCRAINGGVNVSSCERRFRRVEFGLYNALTDRMEGTPVEPMFDCWAFFPNVSYGEYKGTVQILGCTDCEHYKHTGEPCHTKRHRSVTFITGVNPSEPSHTTTYQISTTAENVSEFIYISIGIFGSLVFMILIFLLVLHCARDAGCLNKTKKPDDELPLIQKDKPSSSVNNKVLVIYQTNHSLHVGAVMSFCKLLKALGIDVVFNKEMEETTQNNNLPEPKYGFVVVILSEGSLRKCESLQENTAQNNVDTTTTTDCFLDFKHLMNNATVFFVSFGYGLEFISDFYKYFPIERKNVFSLTREIHQNETSTTTELSPPTRRKRELNLSPFLSIIHLQSHRSDTTDNIHRSEEAQSFLYNVNRVME